MILNIEGHGYEHKALWVLYQGSLTPRSSWEDEVGSAQVSSPYFPVLQTSEFPIGQ